MIFLESFLVDFVFAQNAIILSTFSSFNESGCRKAKLAAWGLSGFDSALNLGLGIAALYFPYNNGFGMVTLIKTVFFVLILAVQSLGYSIWIISKLFKVRNTVLPNGDRIDRIYLKIWIMLVTFVFVDWYFELIGLRLLRHLLQDFQYFLVCIQSWSDTGLSDLLLGQCLLSAYVALSQ